MTSERSEPVGSVSVHDGVLTAIPASLCLAAVAGVVLPVSAASAMVAGAIPAAGTVGYALFYNPPVR